MQRLELHRVRVLGIGLLGLKHHDAVVSYLLLAQNGSLRAMDDKVAQRVVSALAILLQAEWIVLEEA